MIEYELLNLGINFDKDRMKYIVILKKGDIPLNYEKLSNNRVLWIIRKVKK